LHLQIERAGRHERPGDYLHASVKTYQVDVARVDRAACLTNAIRWQTNFGNSLVEAIDSTAPGRSPINRRAVLPSSFSSTPTDLIVWNG
jgi:hypothetical protein